MVLAEFIKGYRDGVNAKTGKVFSMKTMSDLIGVDHARLQKWEQDKGKPKDYNDRLAFEYWFGIKDFEDISEKLLKDAIIRHPEPVSPLAKATFVGESNFPPQSPGDLIRQKKAFGEKEKKGIIWVPIPAQAGYAKNFLNPVFMSELGRWRIEGLPYEGERFRVFQVKGSSMEYMTAGGRPAGFFEGQDVVAEIVEPYDWKTGQIPPYHVYVIVTEDEILIKRILIKEDGTYIMHSDNPDEKPRQRILPKEDIRELWFVKRKLDWDMSPPDKIEIEI